MAVPETENEQDDIHQKDRTKQKHSNSTKSKDLSHVPCKFYRVGSCTAGSSCPFSHSSPSRSSPSDPNNPPQPKDVCAWFVKGTCKFGHKCALAHILPGQSMAMDRKNKKAAQIAAGGGQGGGKGGKSRTQRDHGHAFGSGAGGGGGGTGAGSGGGGGGTNATTNTTTAPRTNPLLSGSTAPTRSVHPLPISNPSTPTAPTNPPPSRLQMPTLKATISPSAPAPPLKDTDFATFAMMGVGGDVHDSELPSAPAQTSLFNREDDEKLLDTDNAKEDNKPAPTSPLPLSNTRRQQPTRRPSHDFGPIGSPPRSSPHTHILPNLNGFSPGTSPQHDPTDYSFGGMMMESGGRSPFSAPAQTTQSTFLSSSSTSSPAPAPTSSSGGLGIDLKQQQYRSGLASSLGTAHLSAMMGGRTRSGSGTVTGGGTGWSTDFGPVPSQVLSASVSHAHTNRNRERDAALEDEDLEEFIPGSLSDLLTPNERSRRMSRTNSGQQPSVGQQRPILSAHNSNSGGSRHHYSRSVPAPSLLGDIKSIWASTDTLHPPATATTPNTNLGIGGTPSSFKSTTNFGGLGDGTSPSYGDRESSILSPTNASAAFLGGLHHHYINRTGTGVQRSVSGERERTGLQAHSNFSGLNGNGSGAGMGLGLGGTTFSPPRLNAFGSRPPFSIHDTPPTTSSASSHVHPPSSHGHSHLAQDLNLNGTSSNTSQGGYLPTNRQPVDTYHNNPNLNPQAALSPSTRALQSHAPGQSLPQGLAAGYSRIHALPPPPTMGPSPSFSGVGSPGSVGGVGSGSPGTSGMEWLSLGPKVPTPDSNGGGGGNGGTGLESMFSRLSYSAATSRPSALSMTATTATSTNNNPSGPQTSTAVPSTTTRNPSGGKPWQSGSGAGGGGPLSPLSGPVLTGDDDDLFSMDG